MFHAPMVSLARKPADTKQAAEPMLPLPSAPQYPYGCCISLDDETLERVGLDGDLPAPGELVHFCCTATVTSASKDPGTGCCRVELQITEMGVPGSPENRGERWYGDHEEPDGDED